ncbi:MAG: VOC family protein [Polyangiaceae bacterium]
MSQAGPIGILGIEAIHYYVRDLERSRRFYTERLDFSEIGASGSELESAGRQRSLAFQAGACRVICSSPLGEGGRASRYLKKHPDGIGSIVFAVDDIDRAFSTLESRGGTPVDDIRVTECDTGRFRTFVLATPIGDTTFRFVERKGEFPLYPGFERRDVPGGGGNAFGFARFDHVTSNFETMSPALLWMEHVLGFERFWQVQFHTDDVATLAGRSGSGLRSAVMWDPASGVKFANNEPRRPNFKASQINVFHEEHRGDSVQHVALTVSDIVGAVRGLRGRGVQFMGTPKAYYEALPERMKALGVGAIAEPLEALEELQILADGDGPGRYLLQIFLKDSAGLYESPDAGPFFYEIIQRHGDSGFGAGNFRALFESIERKQLAGQAPR